MARGALFDGLGDVECGDHVAEFVFLVRGNVRVVFWEDELLQTIVDFKCCVSDVWEFALVKITN